MHAVLITFRSAVAPDALAELFDRHAEALQVVPGLVMKTWLHDGETLGGFHLFATRATAEEYLASGVLARLAAHPAFAARAVRHFAVLGELSHATGTPRPLGA
jgi:hypothetical protein